MERRAIVVRGVVQGVGFRPFVYNLAERLHITGFVRNQTGTVLIEAEGEPSALDGFLGELTNRPPPLALIEDLSWEAREPQGERTFQIKESDTEGPSAVFISPDVATCADCLAELFDPRDRRFGYPFLNCTHCGPRLTIIEGAPYDRARTTMAAFPMCAACRAEYEDPADRRFHAQPIACPVCGPRLTLLDAAGQVIDTREPLAAFARALQDGKIGALKSLGGYHLSCLASDSTAVAELRRRKHRDEKPFAVMVADLSAAGSLAIVGPAERALLESPRGPIVLLRRKAAGVVADPVAPGNPWLGLMLPFTPLHHLLLRAVGGQPLVMTSGNRSDEPIVYRDDETVTTLAGIADLFLTHDRAIHVRCDDSVTRVVNDLELPIRRSRGYAPRPTPLPIACPCPTLALGGQLKATFALGRGRQAFLSHHMGDLEHFDAYQALITDVSLYQRLFGIEPECLVHDLHPDYATTQYARQRGAGEGIPLLAVQHHHAHLASCMVENGLIGPVIGITLDGTGYGLDGHIWGGEFLIGDYRDFRRAAHLRYVGMPGGEAAIREPWRMAIAHLADAAIAPPPALARVLPLEMKLMRNLLERRFNTPYTSSTGRLFDAIAVLAGVRDRVNYEGQAAVELEWLATGVAPDHAYPFEIDEPHEVTGSPRIIDTRPLIQGVAGDAAVGVSAAVIARRFHSTMVEMIASVCGLLRQETGVHDVVLSGGVFLNALLTSEVSARLVEEGFDVSRHRLVPPNDGGLSLGQLAVAAARLA